MNKQELIESFANEFFGGNIAAATRAFNLVLDHIAYEAAWNDKVTITGFGIFERIEVPERTVRNPLTGERKVKPAHNRINFRPGADLLTAADYHMTPRVAARREAARARAAR